jgi:hypothetical protein
MSGNKTYTGKYRPLNKSKYRGNIDNIEYRSGWEHRFMKWCDKNPSVLEWGSEEVVIPYVSPTDGKVHRYFVDFFIKVRDKFGGTKKYLIEIKPAKFTVPPKEPKRKTKRFVEEWITYQVNQAKWKAAEAASKKGGFEFIVLTEQDLGLETRKPT